MILKSISSKARMFGDETRRLYAEHPEYILDETWPTIGVLDRFCFWLRGKEQWDSKERSLVHFIACYIAAMAHDLWAVYGGKILVDLVDGKVHLRLEGGPYVTVGASVGIPIEQELRRLLARPSAHMPVIGDFERTVHYNYNRLSLFGLGVLLGPCPMIEGPWSTEPLSKFDGAIDSIVQRLAEQSAAYYSRRFPNERLGQDVALYTSAKLIYPPTLMSEQFPGEQSARGVIDYCVKKGASAEEIFEFASNLCLIPDERFSLTGLIICAALPLPLPEHAVALAEELAMFSPLLRISVVTIREHLGAELCDWLVSSELKGIALRQFQEERKLNFFPLLQLSTRFIEKYFSNEKIRKAIVLLCLSQVKQAVDTIRDLIEDDPTLLELRLQLLWLESMQGDYPKIEKGIRQLLSETEADTLPGLYALWGHCLSLQGDLEGAARRFKGAYNICTPTNDAYPFYALQYAKSCASLRQFEEALEVLSGLTERGEMPCSYWMTRIAIERALGRSKESDTSMQSFKAISPYHKAIIGELMVLDF